MDQEDLELLVKHSLAGALGGSVTGFYLSFTSLSPLVIGGIVSCALWAVFTAIAAGCLLYVFRRGNKEAQDGLKSVVTCFSVITIAASAVGVGLGAVANSLFPGVMSGTWTAILAGAIIGAVGAVSAFLVHEYLINPAIEKVAGYFSERSSDY